MLESHATAEASAARSRPKRIENLVPDNAAARAGKWLREVFFRLRLPKSIDPQRGCWMDYLTTAEGLPILVRRNEASRRIAGAPMLPYCVSVCVQFEPSDEAGLASNDGPGFDRFELALRQRLCGPDRGLHVATVTYQGSRQFIFYCASPWNGDPDQANPEAPSDAKAVFVESVRDDRWRQFRRLA